VGTGHRVLSQVAAADAPLLLGRLRPNFFFGDLGELIEGRHPVVAVDDRYGTVASSIIVIRR
jgi:hypothetical protein